MPLITNFVVWYFKYVPSYLLTVLVRLVNFLDSELAVTLMLSVIFNPLFGDTSIIGRILGFSFRLIRVVFGALIIAIFVFNFFIVLGIWFLMPVIMVFFGFLSFLFYLVSVFCLYLLIKLWFPIKHLHNISSPNELGLAFPYATKKLFKLSGESGDKFLDYLLGLHETRDLLAKIEIRDTGYVKKLFLRNFSFNKNEIYSAIFDYRFYAHMVSPSMVFLALVKVNKDVQNELIKHNITIDDIEIAFKWQVFEKETRHPNLIWELDYENPKVGGVNRLWFARPTPELDSVSEDITQQAAEGRLPPIFGKKEVVKDIKDILSKRGKRNVVIVGKPGSGKSSVVQALAQDIITGESAEEIRFKRIVKFDASKMLSLGIEAGSKVNLIVEELKAESNTILFVDDIHILSAALSVDKETSPIFAAFLPLMERGEVQVIGTTNPKDLREHIETNPSLHRLFDKVELKEPSREDLMKILQYSVFKSNAAFSVQALKEIITLSDTLIHNKVFPDKAVSVVENIISKSGGSYVDRSYVKNFFTKVTGVPVSEVNDQEEKEKLLSLEDELNSVIISQPGAVKAISNAVIRAKTGTRNDKKPIASFLFAGPTGVGKTYTAKMLSTVLFGSDKYLSRFDMSEFQTTENTNDFIDRLCVVVREKLFNVILLDEIEKANNNLILALLQVLDEGRLTDTQGNPADFRQSFITATTNVGSTEIKKAIFQKFNEEDINAIALESLNTRFVPEFLNRFSEIIVFSPLNSEAVKHIVTLELEKVKKTLKEKKGVDISWSQKFVDYVVNNAFSSEYGARAVERFLQQNVETKVAKMMLGNEVSMGESLNLDEVI